MSDETPHAPLIARSSSRVFRILLALLCLLVGLFAYYHFSNQDGVMSEQVSTTLKIPDSIQAIPGSVNNSEKYTELLLEANQQRYEEAEKTASSAIPTIVAHRSIGSCTVGRYNALGQCDPHGLYDVNGHMIYNQDGSLICPSQRYNAERQCDPSGLYDINHHLVYDNHNHRICTSERYNALHQCDPFGQFDAEGNPLNCPSNRYNLEMTCDPNGSFDKNGHLLGCPSGRYNAQRECDPQGLYNRFGQKAFDADGHALCASARYTADGRCDPQGRYNVDGHPLPEHLLDSSATVPTASPASKTDRACPSAHYNAQGICDPHGLYTKDGMLLSCPSGHYNAQGLCDPKGLYNMYGRPWASTSAASAAAAPSAPAPCPSARYDAKGDCDPQGLYDAQGKLLCPSARYDQNGRCDPQGLYNAAGSLLCPSARYDKNGQCDAAGLYNAQGQLLCPSQRYNAQHECDPAGFFNADGQLIPNTRLSPQQEAQRALEAQRAQIEKAQKERLEQQEAEQKRLAEERAQAAFQQQVAALTATMQNQAQAAMQSWNVPALQQYTQGAWAATDPNLNAAYAEKLQKKHDLPAHTAGTEAGSSQGSSATDNSAQAPSSSSGAASNSAQTIIKAGTIWFATLDTGVNTDSLSPVMATVVQGPYKGAKLIGAVSVGARQESVTLSFTQMSLPQLDKSISTHIVALNADSANTALASDVDRHILLRYGSLFASSFMQGYGQAIQQSGTTTTLVPSTGASVTARPNLSGKQEFMSALGTVGQQWSTMVAPQFQRPNTVTVDAGSSIGLLFLNDLSIPDEATP